MASASCCLECGQISHVLKTEANILIWVWLSNWDAEPDLASQQKLVWCCFAFNLTAQGALKQCTLFEHPILNFQIAFFFNFHMVWYVSQAHCGKSIHCTGYADQMQLILILEVTAHKVKLVRRPNLYVLLEIKAGSICQHPFAGILFDVQQSLLWILCCFVFFLTPIWRFTDFCRFSFLALQYDLCFTLIFGWCL